MRNGKGMKEFLFRIKTMWTIPKAFLDNTSFGGDVYVLIWGPYMYFGESPVMLFFRTVTGFWSPKNLVG